MAAGTFRRAASYTLLGNAVWSAANFLIFTYIAKTSSLLVAGIYGLTIAITSPLNDFSQLNLRALQNTDVKREYVFGDYLGLRILGVVAMLLLLLPIAFVSTADAFVRLCIFLFGVKCGVEAFSDVLFGHLQQMDRLDYVGISLGLRGALGSVALCVALWLTQNLAWAIAAYIGVSLIALLAFDLPFTVRQHLAQYPREELIPRFNRVPALFWLAIPLGITILLVSLNMQAGRYIVNQFLGKDEVAVITGMAYLIVIGRVVVIAAGTAASTRLARFAAAHDPAGYARFAVKLTFIALAAVIFVPLVGYLAGQPILRALYSEAYVRPSLEFALVLLGGALSYLGIIFGYMMTSLRVIRPQVLIYTAVLVVTVVTGWLWIPSQHLMGYAWSSIAGNAVLVLGAAGCAFHGWRQLAKEPATEATPA